MKNKYQIVDYDDEFGADIYLYESYKEEFDLLQELVDKATPKKVDKNTKGIFPNNDTYLSYHTTYACPNCNCKLHLDWHEKRNYCPECGQKLDWSDNDE